MSTEKLTNLLQSLPEETRQRIERELQWFEAELTRLGVRQPTPKWALWVLRTYLALKEATQRNQT